MPIIDAGIKVLAGDKTAEEGIENGYFCTKEDGTPFTGAVWPGLSYFTDYLNPEARKWFGHHYQILMDQGIEGFWNDMNEPSIFFTDESIRRTVESVTRIGVKDSYEIDDWQAVTDAVSGMSNQQQYYDQFYHTVNGKRICHKDVHNLYGYNMTRAAGEAFEDLRPGKRMLMFSRSSYNRDAPLRRHLDRRQRFLVGTFAAGNQTAARLEHGRTDVQRLGYRRI